MRIASLLASGTEIVAALGLEDQLIAISHECDHPASTLDRPRLSRPRFDPAGLDSGQIDRAVRQAMLDHGSVYEVDGDALERLRPDVVITQAVCEVCAVPTPGVRELVSQRGLPVQVLSLDAHTIEEILSSIELVGRAAGVEARARELVVSLRVRLARVGRALVGATRPRVLAIEWLDPPFTPGHWVPEMIALAGGENLAGTPGGHSHQVDWSDLEGLDPDVLILMPCGYGLEASEADANRHAEALRRVAPRAIDDGRAFVVDGSSYFNRSGPRVVDGVEILAGLLHPDAFAVPDPTVARRWRG
jgi:iron complex transport system substrate-binding protein